MTIQTRFSVTTTSYNRAMCGCTNCRWWWISRARFESSFFADLSTTYMLSTGIIKTSVLFLHDRLSSVSVVREQPTLDPLVSL